MSRRLMPLVLVLSVGLVSLSALAVAGPRAGTGPTRPKDVKSTAVRVARSADGLTFSDAGEVFSLHAAAPSLLRLPDGDLLAVVDFAGGGGSRGTTVMGVSRSKNDGVTWSPLEPIRVAGRKDRPFTGRRGVLTLAPGDAIRLYYVARERLGRDERTGKPRSLAVIRSALSRDGASFRPDARTNVHVRGEGEIHPTATWIARGVHLFADTRSGQRGSASPAQHLISRDGRRFARVKPVRSDHFSFVGSIVPLGARVRGYFSDRGSVRSAVTRDGRTWRPDEGIRLTGGDDPAVVKLGDGAFLMFYCAPIPGDPNAKIQLAAVAPALHDAWREIDKWKGGAGAGGATRDGSVASADGSVDAQTEAESTGEGTAGEGEGSTALAGGASPDEEGAIDTNAIEAEILLDEWMAQDQHGFAPPADLHDPVDYMRWYEDYATGYPAENAYYAYAAFIPDLDPNTPDIPPLPPVANMYSSDAVTGPPGPWDPDDHPEWAAANDAMQDVLAKYRDAALYSGYSQPALFEDGEECMFALRLPALSSHRRMAKELMADAWRLRDGEVSSEHMLEAWRTTFRNASHLEQGATLIEELVGNVQREFVEQNARWALREGVFSGDKLEAALDTLMDYDEPLSDPRRGARGEHAFTMDTVQYIFSPPGPAGTPVINPDRVDKLIDWSGSDGDLKDRLSSMTPDDAQRTIEAVDRHYRKLGDMFEIGYPEVRAADIDGASEDVLHTSPVTEAFLPALGRLHQLRARREASRRVTRLAYASHLFKERQGRWPASLDELPARYSDDARSDPFTGRDFGFRLSDDGPTIYSASENGVDDGGVHSRRWDDEITNDTGSDDHVLWPPQRRR